MNEAQEETARFLRDAWTQVRLEGDRTLMTLCAGGLGLLATALRPPSGECVLTVLWLAGAASFAVGLFGGIQLLRVNADYLNALQQLVLHGSSLKEPTSSVKLGKRLESLDRLLKYGFYIGAVATILFAFALILIAPAIGEGRMTDETKDSPPPATKPQGPGELRDLGLGGLDQMLNLGTQDQGGGAADTTTDPGGQGGGGGSESQGGGDSGGQGADAGSSGDK